MKLVRCSRWFLLFVLLGLAAMLLIYPVRNGITRPAIVLIFPVIYGVLLSVLWHRRALRWVTVAVGGILLIVFIFPGRDYDRSALQTQYLASLRSYIGTTYVWGGENHFGVDCSGLVRAGMVDAEFHEAARQLNPRLLREGCWLWWHDIAARDMPKGYAGRMETLSSSTRRLVIDQLRAGDVAVTDDGGHVIAYLGNDQWIEADPIGLAVTEWNGTERLKSIDLPMIFIRWNILK
jgi:hypothetical protein